MSERYLVTGVQLSMLEITDSSIDRHKLVEDIVDKQFIANSEQPIEVDVHNIIKMLR